jgi:hypothetical protein
MEAIASQAPESSTPILDRLAPMPPPAKPTRKQILLGVAIGAVGSVIIDTLAWQAPTLWPGIGIPFLHWLIAPWTELRFLSLALSFLVVGVASVFIHEAGHVLGGLATGFRFLSMRVGPIVLDRSFRISWYWGPAALSSGLVRMSAARRDHLRLRAGVFVLAGPAANLLSGGLALVLLPTLSLWSTLALIAAAAAFILSILPFRTRVGPSDGSRLWMLWRHRALCERWLILMKLEAENQEGVLTQARRAEYVAKAIGVLDSSPETVVAHSFAFLSALSQGRYQEAGELLEICLRYSSRSSPPLRHGLISDVVVFQARQRKRADLAALWLADLQSTPTLWLRARAEAALLEAQGDIAGALRKLDEYEAALLALPNKAQRDILLRELPAWRSELQAA